MKINIILFSLSLLFAFHCKCLKAMLIPTKKHRLDHVGQQMYERYSGDKNSIFVAPPELFVPIPYKTTFIEFLQKNGVQSQQTHIDQSTKENKLFLSVEKK